MVIKHICPFSPHYVFNVRRVKFFASLLTSISPYSRQRSFSTGSDFDAQFVPFRFAEEEALNSFRRWAESQWLAPQAVRNVNYLHEVRAVFLPFWVFDVVVTTRATANIGQVSWGVGTNEHGRIRPSTELTWMRRTLPNSLHTSYTKDLPEMQVYGSTTFKRDNVQVCKLPVSVVQELDTTVAHGQEVDVWTLNRTVALKRIIKQIHAMEVRRAEQEFRRVFVSSLVKEIDVKMELHHQSYRVYFPAYTIAYSHLGRYFRTFVNGFDGRIDGIAQFSAVKVTAALVLTSTLILNALVSIVSPFLWFASVLLPSIAIGISARFWPILEQRVREQKRFEEQQNSNTYTADSEHSDDERRRESRFEWERRYQERMKQHSHHAPSDTINMELYNRLKVSRTASLDEISRAFRAQALKWHPDVHRHARDKQRAAAKFRDVMSAYKILRDPKRRSHYDRTGRIDAR